MPPNEADVEDDLSNGDEFEADTELEDASLAEGAEDEIDDGTHAIGTSRYHLRPGRTRNYEHRLDHQMDNPDNSKSYDGTQLLQQEQPNIDMNGPNFANKDELRQFITGFIMTQMTADAGIKKHGQRAIEALFKEFSQLDTKIVFEGIYATDLTPEQKREALRAVNLIKEKRTGELKGRSCADGRKQRDLYPKEETASPTVSNDALTVTHVIDGKELRDVACADVTGAYLNADMDVFTLLKLTGEAVSIMCKANPEYEKFVAIENGKCVLYLRLLKALYGCVRSALLWYELFSSTLVEMGFELNPYDACVANKVIDGHQCTVAWYVDDNKISHKDPNVVSSIIEKIEGKFGKMTVTRGKTHNFLGTEVQYHEDGTVSIRMIDYLKEAIADYGEQISRKPTTPARNDLFEINEDSPRLEGDKAKRFHSIVAKLLYVSKRGRIDIQLPIAFLCTRVSKSTEQDWSKLRRVLEFLNGTLYDALILGADDLAVLNSWADAAYSVHADMKSHTGGAISFGRGALMSKSSKQKLNTKSSTEAELVGASDYITSAIWLKKFLSAQGYELKSNIFHQDNQSAIRMERNGRMSAGQKSRHIDIRYYFIRDQIKRDDITLHYCPTECMLADFFTKPLQGALFKKLRAAVMGHEHTSTLGNPNVTTSQERVGNNDELEKESARHTDDVGRNEGKTQCVAASEATGNEKEGRRTYADVVKQDANGRIVWS